MRRITWQAGAEDDGKALRAVLRGSMGLSASLVKAVKWLPDGILLDGAPARLDAVVRRGQTVSVALSVKQSAECPVCARQAPPMPPILYEDDCLLVVDKPAGMAVHPSAGHEEGTLFDAVSAWLRQKGDENSTFCPISRLDRHTSGVLCAAKNRFAAQRLSGQMQKGQMRRVYRAVVCGSGLGDNGVVDAPIARAQGIRRAVAPEGRRAVTHWQVLRRGQRHMLLELWLETGRTHQIRVHMAHLGFPVYGDFLYGTEDPSHPGFALHAQSLSFVHPLDGRPMSLSAPTPPWFDTLLED